VVISNGKVVEQGTHEELLAQKGHYHALVTAQHLNTIDGMENGNNEESEGWLFEQFVCLFFINTFAASYLNKLQPETAHPPSKHKDKHGLIILQCKHTEL